MVYNYGNYQKKRNYQIVKFVSIYFYISTYFTGGDVPKDIGNNLYRIVLLVLAYLSFKIKSSKTRIVIVQVVLSYYQLGLLLYLFINTI